MRCLKTSDSQMAADSAIAYSLVIEGKMMHDTVVQTFEDVLSWHRCRCPIITIYKRPADYPTKYIARLFDLETPTPFIAVADTLDEARESIPGRFIRFPPNPCDEAHIVEVYI